MSRVHPRRTYVRTSEAWYADANRVGPAYPDSPESVILNSDDEGGQLELVVKWHQLGKLAAQVTVFDESWGAFGAWADLWEALAEASAAGGGMAGDYSCAPDEFIAILDRLGFEDVTERDMPDHLRAEPSPDAELLERVAYGLYKRAMWERKLHIPPLSQWREYQDVLREGWFAEAREVLGRES